MTDQIGSDERKTLHSVGDDETHELATSRPPDHALNTLEDRSCSWAINRELREVVKGVTQGQYA